MEDSPKLEMLHVSKKFPGVQALDDVCISVNKGSVMALCGENGAGKSTLMKILSGIYKPDNGDIFINGEKVKIANPIDSRSQGIFMMYQELSYVPDLTVGENIVMGMWPQKKGFVDWKKIKKQTNAILEKENVSFDSETKLKELRISEIQLIEIIKAVSYNADIIIMDEPTSSLTTKEIEHLFERIKNLRDRGVSIIYISHKMDEVFRISDEITVLRDGRIIDTVRTAETSEDKIIEMMVGRKIENQYPKDEIKIGNELLRVEGLCSKGAFNNINFKLHKGEIVGFAGLMGAGRTETMRALFGLDKYDEGEIFIREKRIRKIKNVPDAIGHGLSMVTEDRRRYGIIPMLSVAKNTSLAALDKFIYRGRSREKEEYKAVRKYCNIMRVKTPNFETRISSLSGGNQQKVILAKWMMRNPGILIMDEPTRGIDVGAKREIFQLISECLKEGMGIIMVSSEMPELINICDRIYVMKEGTITGELEKEDFSQKEILKYAIGVN